MSPGLSLTQQPPVSTVASVTVDAPASVLWQRLAEEGLACVIENEAVGLVADLAPGQRALALEERGVTALDGLFASALARLADDDPIRGRWTDQARRAIEEFGSAEGSALGLHASLDELSDGPLAVLEAADVTPTVEIRLGSAFFDLRSDQQVNQQRDICALLCDLAAVCEVRVVASSFVQAKLRRRHHEALPVSRPCNGTQSNREVAVRVEAAREALDPEGRETSILRNLASEASQTETYHALYASAQASDSRVRQCLGRLADLDLVETFGGSVGHMATVLEAGQDYLDALDSEIGVQQDLPECVSDPPNPSDENVYTPEPPSRESAPPDGGGGGSAERSGRGGWTNAAYLSRHEHVAVTGAVKGVDIALSDHPVEGSGRSPLFSYDDDRDEVVAGGEFHSALSWLVCTARALAGPKMRQHVLTADRLDAEADLGALPDPEIWTRCSQGGWCSKDECTAEQYLKRLADALEGILNETRQYRHLRDQDNHEEADETARHIIRHCQGLIGTVTRMLDYCGVDLVRYVQLPEYSSDWHTSEHHRRRRSILRTIAKTSTIAGAYGAYTAERTLYEQRTDKREFALGAPQVTNDRSGSLIGSWMIAGRGVTKLLDPESGPSLKSALRNPGELQEGATNYAGFDVPLSIRTDRSPNVVRVVTGRMLAPKNTRPTDRAVRILGTCTGSVFDVARALNHLAPEPEDMPRAIHLDEVRRALSTVPAERLLTDTKSRSAGRLLKTMLTTSDRLTQTELADRADVSTQTVRNNTDCLEALALVERTVGGPGEATEWRCSLPTREERDERGTAALEPDRRAAGPAIGRFTRMVEDLTATIASPDVVTAHGTEIRDLNTLRERCPALTPWLRLAVTLCGQELPTEYGDLVPGERQTTSYGPPPSQASLAGPPVVAD